MGAGSIAVHPQNSGSATLEVASGHATVVRPFVRSHADARPPNVLQIVLDCARAKSFGDRAIGKVAQLRSSTVSPAPGPCSPKAVAPSNWTIPSHMSIFTGAYPSSHGLRTFRKGDPRRRRPPHGSRGTGTRPPCSPRWSTSSPATASSRGSITRSPVHAGMSDEDRTSSNRLASHTDALYSPWVRSLLERLPPFVVPLNMVNHPQEEAFKREVCGSYVIDGFEQWIGRRDAERPFHAFFNLVDAHEPYPIIANGHRTGPLARWYGRTPRYYLLAVPGFRRWSRGTISWPGTSGPSSGPIEKVGRILDVLERAGRARSHARHRHLGPRPVVR